MKVKMKNPISKAVYSIKKAKAKLEAQKTDLEQEIQTASGERILMNCTVWTNMAKGVSQLEDCTLTKLTDPSNEPSVAVIRDKD